MSITTLEQANIAIGRAATLVDLHDSILGRILKARADYELGMVKRPEDFNPTNMAERIKAVEKDVRDFERRVVLLSKTESFQHFRRLVIQAQHMLEILTQFQERIDQQAFLLKVYTNTNLGPQHKLSEGEVYDQDQEDLKMKNLVLQYEDAATQYVTFLGTFDVGEISTLELPTLVTV